MRRGLAFDNQTFNDRSMGLFFEGARNGGWHVRTTGRMAHLVSGPAAGFLRRRSV